MQFKACFLAVWLGCLFTTPQIQAVSVLLGPVEERTILDDFPVSSQNEWQASSGGNIVFTLACGRQIPGVVDSAMQIDFKKKNPKSSDPGQNWFAMKRQLHGGIIKDDGLRFLIGSATGGEWWLRISLQVGKESYSHVAQPILPARATIEQVIPWAEFTSGTQALTRDKVASADGISIETSVAGSLLYLAKITTFRQQTYHSWLEFKSSHSTNNIYEPGQKVTVTLKAGGTIPANAKAFRYEVSDFFESITATGKVTLKTNSISELDLTPKLPGYYELRAYWQDEAGKDLESRSCLLSEGTLPPGVLTFAVMPRTVAQNLERYQVSGTNAFFGLHGDFAGLADLMGLPWRLDYTRWPFLEPTKPDRSKGMAAWAEDLIQHSPPRPSYQLAVLPFCGNFGPPDWAKSPKALATPYANWNDYLAMVRDYVAVKKHFYPHMHPRIYGVAWEVNLNMPPSNFWPIYTPADIVELHRRTRETIKAADPESMIIGPCPSNMNSDWFESVFKAGLLDYVDGIESHGYSSGTFTPEENDYPGKLATLRELMRRYHGGKTLPIFITEAAFRGMLGSKIIARTQAQVTTRLAIILKGEGVRVFLPFYGIDYDRDGWWGFCFNLDVDKNPWATQRISPKPTVNAIATCAGVLEDAVPVRRVQGLGDDVWAYLFDRKGTRILSVWNPRASGQVQLQVGKTSEAVELMDTMGGSTLVKPRDGIIELNLDSSPKYVIGLGKEARIIRENKRN